VSIVEKARYWSRELPEGPFDYIVIGSIYGLASEPERFTNDALTPKTGIKGLYMAGVDVMAPGIAGAIGGGALAVAAAEPVAALRYLRPIMKG
jgi:phytoene dehydrogenase-like protein